MEIFKNDLLIHTNFLTLITISLFYCGEKVFIFTNIWMIGKNFMNYHCLENKTFTAF